jgi:transposase
VILTNGTPIRGVHKIRSWGKESKKLHTHIYYNPEKAVGDRNELYGYVASLKKEAIKDPANPKLQNEYKRYLIVRKSKKAEKGVTVNIREEVVEKELKTAGWFVLISNHVDAAQAAYDIYRIKDVVEKAFLKYKSNLGLDRLRVHNSERMQNKTFIAFIALIIVSHIYNVMKEKQLHKRMTFEQLLMKLSKLKVAAINGSKVFRPLTKEQNEIFKAFDMAPPNTEFQPDASAQNNKIK